MNNSSPLGLVNCDPITMPITNSETISSRSKDGDVHILIAIIVVYILAFVLISAAFIGVIVALMVSRRSRNSTTQNMNNTNAHTSTATIDLTCNAAYGVTTETQRIDRNREGSSVVVSENDAYGATALNRSGQLEHSYELISIPPHAELETL